VFRHNLYDLTLETGQSISAFVYSKKEWNTTQSITPLYQNIKREGIYL